MVIVCAVSGTGCESMNKAQIGGLSGAGVGALIGQAIGGNTAGTLIGAGVGTGLGYIIGNEMDKNDAKKRQTATAEEMRPLANTAWKVTNVTPKPKKAFTSIVARFNDNGTVTTTTTYPNGKVESDTETFRIVGSTLIINKPDYVINSRFRIEGNRMYMDTGDHSVVLHRI